MAVLNKRTDTVPSGAVYIGRPGPWGNPFVIGRDGSREEVIAKYRNWLKDQIRFGHIAEHSIAELYGKDLVCWCSPQACHGDVLQKAAAYYYWQAN